MPTGCCIGTYLNGNGSDRHGRNANEHSKCGGLEGHDEKVVIEREERETRVFVFVCRCRLDRFESCETADPT